MGKKARVYSGDVPSLISLAIRWVNMGSKSSYLPSWKGYRLFVHFVVGKRKAFFVGYVIPLYLVEFLEYKNDMLNDLQETSTLSPKAP